MKLLDKEHYELLAMFEREKLGRRYEKEPQELWHKSRIYQCGETNNLFLAYRRGYSFGKTKGDDA